jgi:hypothetical protein
MKAKLSRIELDLVMECFLLLHTVPVAVACRYIEYEVLRRGTYVMEAKQLYCLLPSNIQKHHRILLKVAVSCNNLVRQSIELCWNIDQLRIFQERLETNLFDQNYFTECDMTQLINPDQLAVHENSMISIS